jgi:hypothetical protein
VVCMDAPKDHFIRPCMHMCTCEACTQQLHVVPGIFNRLNDVLQSGALVVTLDSLHVLEEHYLRLRHLGDSHPKDPHLSGNV